MMLKNIKGNLETQTFVLTKLFFIFIIRSHQISGINNIVRRDIKKIKKIKK